MNASVFFDQFQSYFSFQTTVHYINNSHTISSFLYFVVVQTHTREQKIICTNQNA